MYYKVRIRVGKASISVLLKVHMDFVPKNPRTFASNNSCELSRKIMDLSCTRTLVAPKLLTQSKSVGTWNWRIDREMMNFLRVLMRGSTCWSHNRSFSEIKQVLVEEVDAPFPVLKTEFCASEKTNWASGGEEVDAPFLAVVSLEPLEHSGLLIPMLNFCDSQFWGHGLREIF